MQALFVGFGLFLALPASVVKCFIKSRVFVAANGCSLLAASKPAEKQLGTIHMGEKLHHSLLILQPILSRVGSVLLIYLHLCNKAAVLAEL